VKIRNNAPAAKAGLQVDDEILEINGSKGYRMSLDKINQLLRAHKHEEIRIVVARRGKEFTYKFKIVDVL
jgi:C-terminal processing protease CtpA/Prc